uniref:Kelch-like family member 33 n=1 Tax=Cyprinus carpio TaxID=7962 RepID=A0A8C1VJ26_CYPCA
MDASEKVENEKNPGEEDEWTEEKETNELQVDAQESGKAVDEEGCSVKLEEEEDDDDNEYDRSSSSEDSEDEDCEIYPKKLYSDPAYPSAVFQALENMMLHSVLTDLTLFTEDGYRFQVHSFVLAAISYLIQMRLRQKPKRDQFICLCLGPEVHGSGLAAVVEFAYTGNIGVLNKENIEWIWSAAVSLQAPRILELCKVEKEREENEAGGKKVDIKEISASYGMVDLLALANDYVLRHFQDVSVTPKFQDLPVEKLKKYLQSDSLCVPSELTVFRAVMSWIEAFPRQRVKLARELMGTVQFPLMTFKEFKEVKSITSWPRIGAKKLYDSLLEEFCSSSSDVQSNFRAYMPKDTLVLVGGERITDNFDKRRPCREMWFSNSLQNHVGLVKKVEWRMLGTLPEKPRFSHGVGVMRGKLYVVGGRHYYGKADTMNCTYRYDPIQNSWQRLTDMHERRGSFTLVVLNGKIYAIGGERDSEVNMESVEVYCPNTNSWRLVDFVCPLDQALCCHAASVWNGTVFLSGGFNSQYQCLSSMTLYHPEQGSTYLAELTHDRALHCMETLGDRLYVAGGVSCDADGHLLDQLACEVYNPVANTWSVIMPFPVPHVGSASAVLEGKVYVIGGYCQEDYTDTKTVHRYDPATERWENMSVTPGPNTYIAACVLPIPAHLRQ